jgi:hypothetical protein
MLDADIAVNDAAFAVTPAEGPFMRLRGRMNISAA